ncbi:MAG: serpin family protein [Carbonactinosporaceae bacterium]
MASVAEARWAFTADLYARLGGTAGNLVFSPYSVASALRMAWYGARGRTADELARVLHIADLDGAVAEAGETAARLAALPRDAVELHVADTVWVQSGLRLEPDYVEALRLGHDVTPRPADFRTAPEPARREINSTVEDATLGHITGLLAEGTIDELSRLVLTDAIYLKAAWAVPFAKHATRDAPFHRPDGSTVPVPMMRANEQYGYAHGDGCQAVQLRYEGGRLAMTVLLPAGAPENLEQRLTRRWLDALLAAIRPAGVDLTVPRFRVSTNRPLNEDLEALGMVEAFKDGRADFTGITRDEPLAVSHVAHAAHIDVDERGTEAAAATAVAHRAVALRVPEVRVVVDRPFLFTITDTASGLPLFLGRVEDPSAR